jgi:hypothetical protein
LKDNIEINEKVLTKITSIEEKVSKSIGIFAVNSDNNVFEQKLEILKNKEKSLKWIISRFIAKQLAFNFDELSFKINKKEYSRFSKQLYFEVDKSLLLTNSFDPYEWARTLISDNEVISELGETSKETFKKWLEKNNKSIHIFEHIEAWKNIEKSKRRRLVILHESAWDFFFMYEPFYRLFLEVNSTKEEDDDVRFITFNSLSNILGNDTYFDAKKYDYAIFDGNIALKWEIYDDTGIALSQDNSTESEISLIDLESSSAQDAPKGKEVHSLNSFVESIDDIWNDNSSHRVKDVEEQIIKSKRNYLFSIIEYGFIPHLCCYFADGADRWKNVNRKGELQFLRHFLSSHEIGLEVSNRTCNILHIGVGSGTEIEPIINGIKRKGWEIEDYTIVDISPNILRMALEELVPLKKKLKHPFNFHDICVDVLEEELSNKYRRPENGHPLIIILVANDFLLSQEYLLENISAIMKDYDFLLVTAKINNGNIPKEDLEKSLESFNISLTPLGINVPNEEFENFFEFKLCSATDKSKIYVSDFFEGYLKLKEFREKRSWTPANIKALNNIKDSEEIKKIEKYFTEIEEIKFFKSYNPSTLDSITSYMNKFGLKVVNIQNKEKFEEIKSKSGQVGLVIQKK